jgi:hypothetical protein
MTIVGKQKKRKGETWRQAGRGKLGTKAAERQERKRQQKRETSEAVS